MNPCIPDPPLAAPHAALYARVSSDRQSRDGTIQSQLDELRRRLTADGMALDEQLRFCDDGFSGASLQRPGLDRLRDAAAAGAIDRLYVLSPDRLARNFLHQLLLMEELGREGVEVVFLNRPLGDSPEDQLLLQMQGAIAEYERTKIGERCRRGRLHAARQGRVSVLGHAPYGYRMARDAGGQAHFDIVLQEAAVVRRIFHLAGVERLSLNEVCRRLHREGIASPWGRDRWQSSTVQHLLGNPAYKGQAAYGRTRSIPPRPRPRPRRGDGEHPRKPRSTEQCPPEQWLSIPVPALVETELFDAVQEQLQENRLRNRARQNGVPRLLRGLVVCRRCGYALHACTAKRGPKHRPRSIPFYRCGGAEARRTGGPRICPTRRVRIDRLEAAVWEDVCALLADPHRVAQEFERRQQQDAESPAHASDTSALSSAAARLEKAMGRLIDAYAEGVIQKQEFQTHVAAARQRLEQIQRQLEQQKQSAQQRQDMRLAIGGLEDFAQRVQGGLEQADWNTKRQILLTLVKRIELDGQDVRIIYRVDPRPFAEAAPSGGGSHCPRRFEAGWCPSRPLSDRPQADASRRCASLR